MPVVAVLELEWVLEVDLELDRVVVWLARGASVGTNVIVIVQQRDLSLSAEPEILCEGRTEETA